MFRVAPSLVPLPIIDRQRTAFIGGRGLSSLKLINGPPRAGVPSGYCGGRRLGGVMFGDPKIIQIGFNKCGTVTLNEFFRANGLSTIHWDDGKFALQLIQRMARREDPFADYPKVTVFTDGSVSRADGFLFESFKHFDYIYDFHPDAYYILNTRDSHDWLISRSNHYDLAERHMRAHGFSSLEEVFG